MSSCMVWPPQSVRSRRSARRKECSPPDSDAQNQSYSQKCEKKILPKQVFKDPKKCHKPIKGIASTCSYPTQKMTLKAGIELFGCPVATTINVEFIDTITALSGGDDDRWETLMDYIALKWREKITIPFWTSLKSTGIPLCNLGCTSVIQLEAPHQTAGCVSIGDLEKVSESSHSSFFFSSY